MEQRPPFESNGSLEQLDDRSHDPVDEARRRRESRLARIAAGRRARFRQTLGVAVLLVVVSAVGVMFALSLGRKAPAPSASTKPSRASAPSTSAAAPATSTTVATPASTSETIAASKPSTTPPPAAASKSSTAPAPTEVSASGTGSGTSSARPGSVTVTVWNGAELTGVAHQAAVALGQDGFHVADVTDADRGGYEQTLIVVRDASDRPAASAVRDSLSIGQIRTTSYYAFSSDVLVIIGKDWPDRLNGGSPSK